MILWSIVRIIDKFSSCCIFNLNIFVVNRLLMIFMTESLSTKDQLIWMFSIQMIIKTETISSSSFNAFVVILSAFMMTLLIVSSIDIEAIALNFFTRYLDVDSCKFQTNFFRNCWLSFSNCFMSKIIIKFIIFWMSNRFRFFMTRMRFEIFNFLSIINFFTCFFTILTFELDWFFSLSACLFDIIIDFSFEYFIISWLTKSSSKSWNFFDWFISDIVFISFNSSRLFSFSASSLLCCCTYLSCSSFILSFLFSMILLSLACWVTFFFLISSLLVVIAIIVESNKTHFDRCSSLFFASFDKMTCVVMSEDFVFFMCLGSEHSLT